MDVLLSSLPPPSQVSTVPTSGSLASGLPPLPPSIANLPAGTLLEGFVVNRDSGGNPVLRTDRGDVLIQSQLFLKTGSEVVVRLTQQSGQTNAKIISVNQQPVEQLVQPAATRTDSLSTQALPGTRAPLPAVLLEPASFGTTAQTQQTIAGILRLPLVQLPPLEQGLTLNVRVLDAPAPQTPAATTTPAATPAAISPTTPSIAAEAQYGAYQSAPSPLPPVQSAATPSPPATPAVPLPPTTAGAPLAATVIGHEGGETIVRTSIGTLKLLSPFSPPLGSHLQLEVTSLPGAPIATPAPHTADNTAPTPRQQLTLAAQFAHDWDTLRETDQLLRQDAPAEAKQLSDRLPNTKSNLVNNALFFLSALRGNDFQRWFGNAASQKLDERSSNLLQRITADFSSLRVITTEQPDQPWQMLYFPLAHEDELHQARLYLRHDEGKGRGHGEDETRFVLEVSLSALGELQIDGLVKGSRQKRQFDVTIRSESALESTIQDDLRALFARAADTAGFSGQIRFKIGQAEMIQPLKALREAAAAQDGSILA